MANTPVDASEPIAVCFHALDGEAALTKLASSRSGLTTEEAVRRIREHGPNVLPRGKRDDAFILLWRQINNPLIWVLIASGAIAMVVDWDGEGIKNGFVILAVVIINSMIDYIQEFRAGKAIEALSEMVPENVTVLRDSHQHTVTAADLVPGDIVMLVSGDRVPADLRLSNSKNLQIDEAMLTGESVPSSKNPGVIDAGAVIGDRSPIAFAGTLVTYGTGTGVVAATGKSTELGKISALLHEATDLETPLTRALAESFRYLLRRTRPLAA
jgi:Ca2+-transporting ATPase